MSENTFIQYYIKLKNNHIKSCVTCSHKIFLLHAALSIIAFMYRVFTLLSTMITWSRNLLTADLALTLLTFLTGLRMKFFKLLMITPVLNLPFTQ